jgi:hypothetical protein
VLPPLLHLFSFLWRLNIGLGERQRIIGAIAMTLPSVWNCFTMAALPCH